jgi:hypothetical protein
MTARTRARSQAAAVRLRPRSPGLRVIAARLTPSWRSLVFGLVLLTAAPGAYLLARETSLFAVRQIEIDGAPPAVAAQVRRALAPLAGTSLMKVDADDIERRLVRLPTVAAASYDRAFPHTLRVYVHAERPLAVLRQGAAAWLVSSDGRVLRSLPHPRLSSLPRIWLPRSASVGVGATLGDEQGRRALTALAPLENAPFPGGGVRDVPAGERELRLILRSGLEIRLGDASNIRLKLAVARRIVPELTAPGYLDVSVPARAVAATNPKVEGRG